MSAALADAIVRIVGKAWLAFYRCQCHQERELRTLMVYQSRRSCCQRYFLMMRLSFARDPETSLYQSSEYSSSPLMRQLNQ